MRVLVTGASGFLGGHVVRAVKAAGATPIAAIHRADAGQDLDCQRVRLSLDDRQSIETAVSEAEADAVIHCAAYGVDHRQQDLATAVAVNVLGTSQLYGAARQAGIERFVSVGTCFEYGSHPGPISEMAPLQPLGVYGGSKAAASMMLSERGRALGCAPVIARAFVMYGPGEGRHKLLPQVIHACRTGGTLDMSHGRELRDWLPVVDVARSLAAIACLDSERFPFGRIFNLCSGRGVSVRSFVEAVSKAAGGRATLRFGALPPRSDVPESSVGDPTQWRSFCATAGLRGALVETPMESVVVAMLEEDASCGS